MCLMSNFESIRSIANEEGFALKESYDAFSIRFERIGLKFEVAVAPNVLEWHLEIEDPNSNLHWSDWADYLGYDKRPKRDLALEMEDHLRKLFIALKVQEFRLVEAKGVFRKKVVCEWNRNGNWVEFDYGNT